MIISTPRQGAVGALLLGWMLLPAIANAQSDRRLEVYGTIGAGQIYVDEGYPDHLEAGGGVRVFLVRGFGVAGELLRFRSNLSYLPNEHRQIGYVSVVKAWGRTNRPLRFYWLGGLSVTGGGNANTAIWPTAGLGARIFMGDRYFVAPEVRGPLFRASISAGVSLGRG